MIRSTISVFFIFAVVFFSSKGFAQVVKDDSTLIFESPNDSLDITTIYYEVGDSLSSFFEYDSLYPKWENNNLYFQKYDFSKKTDTTIIILCDSKEHIYCHPFKGVVTSPFGWRRYQYHTGTDVNLETGDSVRCAFDGIIRVTKYNAGYGNVIVIRHNNGLETLYGHLSKSLVYANQQIKAGEVIGLGGNTGHSRGSHLHFEVRYLGSPLNPAALIDFAKYKVKSDTFLLTAKNFQYFNDTKSYKGKKVAYGSKYYTVRKGDSLSKIAQRNGTTVKALCKLNGISTKTILKIGRKLRVR